MRRIKAVHEMGKMLWSFALLAALGPSVLIAAKPPYVRHEFSFKNEKGTKETWRYAAIRVREAANPQDADFRLFRTQGYEHARQRYFPQMEFFRRLVTGRIAGLVPDPGAAEQDKKFVALGMPEVVRRTTEEIRSKYPDAYRMLEAYTEGVNSYLSSRWLTTATQQWTPEDSMAISVAFSYIQSVSFEDQLFIGSLQQKFYADANSQNKRTSNFPNDFIEFLDFRPVEISPNAGGSFAQIPAPAPSAGLASLPLYQCPTGQIFGGCNAATPGSNAAAIASWRLKPDLGASAVLLSDPHMPLLNGSLFITMALDSKSAGGNFKMRGYSVPGVPGVVIGENEDISWAMNNSMPHSDQVYVEKISEDGKKVLFKNQWVDLETREISLAGSDKKIVLRTVPHHGPIFSDHWTGLSNLQKNTALSWRWSCAEQSLEFVGILKVNRAQDWQQFKEGIGYFCGIAGNFTYADRKGNIGFYQYGKYPKRPWASKKNLPYLPVSGTGDFEWDGYFDKPIEIFNPASGYIAVANDDMTSRNQKPYLTDFADYFSYRQLEGVRSRRAGNLIEQAKDGLSLDDLKHLQNDHYDLMAQHMIQDLLVAADKKGEISATELGKKLLGFDFEMAADSQVALIYSSWLNAIMADTFSALVPDDLYKPFTERSYTIQTLYWTLDRERDTDFDSFKQRMLRAIQTTQTALEKNGNADKTWGQIHRLKLESPLDALFQKVGFSLTPEDIPRGGNFWTIDVAAYLNAAPKDGSVPSTYAVNYGPSFRVISLLAEEKDTRSYTVLARGVSSPLDTDGKASVGELKMYANGEYGPMVPYVE